MRRPLLLKKTNKRQSHRRSTLQDTQPRTEQFVGNETTEKTTSRLREITAVLLRHQIQRGLTPQKLRAILEDLGPTYIKLGQIMSLHSDFLPKAYCEELTKLNSEVTPMSFSSLLEVIEHAYHIPYTEIFSRIDETPLGSASIAQVHRATLRTGEDVIVKVQRKGIYSTMARDIRLMHKAAKLIAPVGMLKNLVDLDRVLDELWQVTQEELNFLKEADNMEEFSRYNADLNYIRIPKLYREYTTTQVLVMEYIGGFRIDDRRGLLSEGYDLMEIGTKLADNYIRQIMNDGFFHADPHPGNIKIQDGKIVWIDMGMMGRLTERDRKILSSAIEGIADHDIGKIQKAVLDIGEFWGEPNREKLYQDIRQLMQQYGSAGMGTLNVAEVFQELTEIMKQNKIRMPHGLTMLARGLTHMEGVLAKLSPEINMTEIAAQRIKEELLSSLDWKKELNTALWQIYHSSKKGMEIPSLVSDILKEYMQGQARLNMELKTSRDLAFLLRKLVRNLVTGLWVSALLIGSSILCLTDMRPKLLGIPLLGAAGYAMAIITVLFVVIRHFATRKK